MSGTDSQSQRRQKWHGGAGGRTVGRSAVVAASHFRRPSRRIHGKKTELTDADGDGNAARRVAAVGGSDDDDPAADDDPGRDNAVGATPTATDSEASSSAVPTSSLCLHPRPLLRTFCVA